MTSPTEIFLHAFITLLVIIEPLSTATVFCSLTASFERQQFRATAFRATIIAFCILLFFGLFGSAVLEKLGVTLPAFHIAGGLLLFVIAFRMLFNEPQPKSVKENPENFHDHDIAVFPIAIPLLAGPGCMTAIILLMSREHNFAVNAIVFGALAAACVASLGCLLMATSIQRMLGNGGVSILTRVMGVVLAAMSVQFVADGLKGMHF